MTSTLDQLSTLMLYSAMVVYALAFIAFALDLARRSAAAGAAERSATVTEGQLQPALVGAAGQSAAGGSTVDSGIGSGATANAAARTADGVPAAAATRQPRGPVSLRTGMSLTVLGFVLHLGATVLRGVAAARVPWANMWEYSMTSTLLIVGVFLVVQLRADLRFLGTFLTGLVLVLLGISTVGFRVDVAPLVPALQSVWLVIHVFVASLGTGFLALGFALSVSQLLQARRESIGAQAKYLRLRFLASLPDAAAMENYAYRLNVVGFIFWTFTLMAGAIWAERAWGRYWGWDTKEVWTFIIWVIYAGYIHARATRGWRGARSSWLSIIGFAAVLFNFGIVNVFFKGLHAYSGL